MEARINVEEILRNCQSGMELDCVLFDNVTFISIEEGTKPICIKTEGVYYYLTEFGTWTYDENAKCVIFPKGKTTWEGFEPPCRFKDGDIVYNRLQKRICIYHYREDETPCISYCRYNEYHKTFEILNDDICIAKQDYRFATSEEKAKLFKAIKDNGYKWNSETKSLEELITPKFKVGDVIMDKKDSYRVKITDICVEDKMYGYESVIAKGIGGIGFDKQDEWELVPDKFDITTLKPFDKVLVRTKNFTNAWTIDFYDGYYPNRSSFTPFGVSGGKYFQQCIPYEGNEYLRGTTNDCDDFYKTWE